LIISDNGSTDQTAEICEAYKDRDERIRYIRQPHNLGPAANFRFLVDAAQAPYFLWAACDDIRSHDFLEENVRFLDAHPDYVASASPNCMEGQDPSGPCLVTFAIEGTVEERFRSFFENSWISHGIFYSLIRTDVLRGCDVLGKHFFGVDWAINLYMASRGKIGRVDKGLTVFGAAGVSKGPNAWSAFRTHPVGWVFPFYKLSIYSCRLASTFSLSGRMWLIKHLIGLNIKSAVFQAWSELTVLLKRKNAGSFE
jgi:glycosyltransferase involved in cell wall biosynthesis